MNELLTPPPFAMNFLSLVTLNFVNIPYRTPLFPCVRVAMCIVRCRVGRYFFPACVKWAAKIFPIKTHLTPLPPPPPPVINNDRSLLDLLI